MVGSSAKDRNFCSRKMISNKGNEIQLLISLRMMTMQT